MTKYVFFILFCCVLLSACGSGSEASQAAKPASTEAQDAKETKATVPKNIAANAEQAPPTFSVKFETTKGDLLIDVTREWAPLGADRFYSLVRAGYYNDVAFFRVIKGFMAQVGISGDPALNATWRTKRITDDPVKQSNTEGMVSFAMGGPNSRTTQIFINFVNNSRLDKMGFASFGKVRDMQPVKALYSEYGEGAPRGKGPNQGRLQMEGNPYLKRDFPELDYIKTAQIIE